MKPFFLITIDTEGDNLWSRPRDITTRNALFLPRFQELCEEHGLKPTYLVDFEMAQCPDFQRFGKAVLASGLGEIGMHLHPQNTPPSRPLTNDDYYHQPYLVEYPEETMRDKIRAMTESLAEVFGAKPVSHRAGRWAFDDRYAKLLMEFDYRVDCSVTPHVSWRAYQGNPDGLGGSDFSQFPQQEYWLDPSDIRRQGSSRLLEVPMTIRPLSSPKNAIKKSINVVARQLAARSSFPLAVTWLRPNGRNAEDMMRLVDDVLQAGARYAEFMLHSSELMPGGSPTFTSPESIEKLYGDLDILFSHVSRLYQGATLNEFYQAASPAHGHTPLK